MYRSNEDSGIDLHLDGQKAASVGLIQQSLGEVFPRYLPFDGNR
jgi:hypothetical protein